MAYEFRNIARLKNYAVNKILPAVYDDSLSYYEVLCKVMDKINLLIANDEDMAIAINDLDQRVSTNTTNIAINAVKIQQLRLDYDETARQLALFFDKMGTGSNGQFLVRTGSGMYDYEWKNVAITIPTGGETGQILAKRSDADADFEWVDNLSDNGVPEGGTTGQVLTKLSNDDYDSEWQNPQGGLPEGGTEGQILTKLTDETAGWANAPTGTIPSGGYRGEVLSKASNDDGDVEWSPAGQAINGIPEGGSVGQIMVKTQSGDYYVGWQDAPQGVPSGGSDGQVLTKDSSETGGSKWATPAETHSIPSGGTAGQVLVKDSNTDYDVDWATPEVTEVLNLTASIGTTWTAEGAYFTQEVNVGSLLSTDNPIVDVVVTTSNYETALEEWAKIFKITSGNGKITVYATEATTTAITIALKVVR